ncbi:MAG: iron(III) transport system ATP-binding protein [Clostridiales bacterium]|jgi:ABC-type Fe3+/spermidine/putrescine transport system ATPase subunit|nr:iron(III) transport system ATP-binding protein [Clostridiales bacterium]MDN5298783.1 iron(III) transport system ATP-binding protein [Clostridiales bacterium]
MSIEIKAISKDYNGFSALKAIDLHIQKGELLALLGPSGCGKTTLLRIISGLLEPTGGEIWFDDINVTKWETQKRQTAMVFQNYALFPHMSVEENVGYGLKIKHLPKATIRKQVDEVLEMVELSGMNERSIQSLSGGQKQRAALARALITKPKILLFDEPLSNLDEKLRVSMRQEIRRIQQSTGITAIYVTHDQREAMAIADKIAVMNYGEVLQYDRPEAVYHAPSNVFTADFMGHVNILPLSDLPSESAFYRKLTAGDSPRGKSHLLLPPNEILLTDADTAANDTNTLFAAVASRELIGNVIRYRLNLGSINLYADSLYRASLSLYELGQTVAIDFSPNAIHLF